jgi:CO/xanthine dehydrogenase Mo-binding subunit
MTDVFTLLGRGAFFRAPFRNSVSTIARGRVAFLDVAAAKAHPGVVEVITPANRPALAQDPDEKSNPLMFRLDLLQNDRVRYAGHCSARSSH